MIIKSMSRKDASFGQLLAYVSRDAADRRFELRHNVLAGDQTALTAEFEANGRLMAKRKNGVVMYHEILSITRARGLSEAAQKEALRGIALDYIRARAPQSLVYGMLHDDRSDQLHYHLVISANPLGASRRHRLSRGEFRTIQVGLEQKVLALQPELEQSLAIGKRAKTRELSQSGVELARRTGKTPRKTALKEKAVAIFGAARDPDHLFTLLTEARLELYRRGKAQSGRASGKTQSGRASGTIGLRDLDTGRTHRLATLGADEAFRLMSARLEISRRIERTTTMKPPQMSNSGPKPEIAPPPESEIDRIARQNREEMAQWRADQERHQNEASTHNRLKR